MPEDYTGKNLKISGKVIQVIEGNNVQQYRIAQNKDYDCIYLVTYARKEGEPRILDDDMVTVYGTCVGPITYESTLGASITIPAVVAFAIDLDD